MIKVTAQAIETGIRLTQGSEIERLEYTSDVLSIFVRIFDGEFNLNVQFANVLGFRVLNERDLMEYWPVCSTQNGWLFEILSNGWLSQEATRPGSCLDAMYPEAKEYLLAGEIDCLSVISRSAPSIQRVTSHGL